ncbi:MAG: hypothetical protein A3F72_18410 [Bacteroidetes bacterium RIFCSPLOWO2_12_FULL_35_15]|nr:MAG: hypothetical protein A3F72_18410 [Bacteroidetes bacterium RIFCSPLOWO2_12_FULL_35_15]
MERLPPLRKKNNMKNKILLFALIMLLINNKSFGQLMTFGFVKNCMTYGRSTVTDELKKKQFFLVERQMQAPANKLFDGAAYYSNEKEDKTKGEIRVLSQINGSKQITEISFVNGSKNDFSKNYTEVYNQIVSFFDNEKAFKSSKYKTDVLKFSKDRNYYYIYKINGIPTIVISNYKIEEDYFSN